MIIGELFERLGLKTDAASFAKGALAAKGVEIALEKIGEAARFVTDQLKEATFGVYDQVDGLAKLSQKVGVSAGSLQELGYAGDLSAVSMDTLAGGLRILNRNATDAVNGSKELKDAFKLAKVELTRDGKIRDTEELFNDLADRFADMPESAAKGALAMKVFGKSGAELLPLLNEGADGLVDLRQEFRELHGTADEDFFKNAQQFNDDLSRVKTAYEGVKQTVGEALLPVLQEALGSVLDWVRANRELIGVKVKEWVQDAVATVRYWIDSIRDWLKEQGGLGAVIDKTKTALRAFLVYLAVSEVVAFAAAIDTVSFSMKGLRAAIAANPLGLLAIALTEMVLLWIENWDDIKEFFEFVWDRLSQGLDSLGDALADFGLGLYDGLVQPFVDAWDWIRKTWNDGVAWIERKLERLGEIISDAAEILNPFNTEGDTRGTRGATTGGSAAEDAAFLAQRQVSDFVAPRVSAGTGARSVSVTSSPSITIVTDPSQSNEQIGRIAAQKIAEHNQGMLREAAGGLD